MIPDIYFGPNYCTCQVIAGSLNAPVITTDHSSAAGWIKNKCMYIRMRIQINRIRGRNCIPSDSFCISCSSKSIRRSVRISTSDKYGIFIIRFNSNYQIITLLAGKRIVSCQTTCFIWQVGTTINPNRSCGGRHI